MKVIPLNEIFHIQYGNQFDLYKLETDETSDINFVSRSRENLGVVGKVSRYKDIEPFPPGLITVTLGGSYLLSSFVQQNVFYTAQNVKVLTPKQEMVLNEKIFYCKAIELNRPRYTSHGREANITLNTLLVPAEVPQEFLNIDISQFDVLNAESVIDDSFSLNQEQWQPVKITNLFDIKGTKTTPLLKLNNYGEGNFPYVTTQATNNGVAGFYQFHSEDGNVLTVDSAVLGYCSYQPQPFSASDHVEKLMPKFKMNKYIALFLVTIMNLEQYRYNYGRKCSQERMREIQIKLPIKDGQPNFEFMENFIKSLPYSKSI